MKKQTIFLILTFTGLFLWTSYEINLLHKNIRQVRREAWFDSQASTDSELMAIKECLEYLESRINEHFGPHPDYPTGYPLWKNKTKQPKDPLIDYIIDQIV
jgi:hypothetical protein